ncbi:hypothetical protein FACS1894200_13950 [Spirochaetia bacterium]|nr:hypothetical protein FACS1894200_13950 [Spirochaetia bacterium]
MKAIFSVRIVNDDGSEYVDPSIVETDIPNEEEYIDGSNFWEVFAKIERDGIPARNEAANTALGKHTVVCRLNNQFSLHFRFRNAGISMLLVP